MSDLGPDLEFILAETAKAAAGEAIQDTPTPTIRPGTIVTVSTAAGEASVLVDGDTLPIDAQLVGPIPTPGVRVMVIYNPPHGAFILGQLGGGGVAVDFVEQNGGADDDLTSAVFTLFPSIAPAADITLLAPPFAVRALISVQTSGWASRTGRNRSQFRVRMGPAAGFPTGSVTGLVHTVEGSSAGSSTPRSTIAFSAEFLVGSGAFTAGLDARFQIEGLRAIGPGFLRRDTLSTITAAVRWSG